MAGRSGGRTGLCGAIKRVRFVFGLESRPQLFQRALAGFIASSDCAALRGKNQNPLKIWACLRDRDKWARASVKRVPFCCLRKDA